MPSLQRTRRAALLRAAGATSGSGKVELPGGDSATAPYLDLPNGMGSDRSCDATYEGWVSVAGAQTSARIFDFGGCDRQIMLI